MHIRPSVLAWRCFSPSAAVIENSRVPQALSIDPVHLPAEATPDDNYKLYPTHDLLDLLDLGPRTLARAPPSQTCFTSPCVRLLSFRCWTTSLTISLPSLHSFCPGGKSISSLSTTRSDTWVYTHTHPSSAKVNKRVGAGCMTYTLSIVQIYISLTKRHRVSYVWEAKWSSSHPLCHQRMGNNQQYFLKLFPPPNLHHLQSYTVLKISTGKYIFINPKTMTQLRKTTTQVEGHRLTLTQVNVSKRTTANLSAQPVFVPHSKLHGLVVLRKEMQKKNTKSEQKLELNQCPTEDCEVNPSAIPRACPRGWTQLLNL